MIKNKRGLSTVITTLIIILLVLVAVSIIWAVIQNFVIQKTEEFDIKAACLLINVRATAVDCSDPEACDVTLTRGAGGGNIDGVKLVFYQGTTGGDVIPVPGDIKVLATKPVTGEDSGLTTPDRVEVTVYINDASGEPQLCPTPTSFGFTP